MLGKKSNISIYMCKDFLLSTINKDILQIYIDNDKIFSVKVKIQDRFVEIRLEKDKSCVNLTIIDPYGFIRMQPKKYKDFQEFQNFIIQNMMSKIK